MQLVRNERTRRGTAAVEFAIVAPLLLTLLVGVWEFGRIIQVKQILTNAARESGRQVSTGNYTPAEIQTFTRKYLKRAGLPTNAANAATVTVTNVTGSGDPLTAQQLDRFRITVTVLYGDICWIAVPSFSKPTTQLTATVDWNSTRDLPVVVNSTIPLY